MFVGILSKVIEDAECNFAHRSALSDSGVVMIGPKANERLLDKMERCYLSVFEEIMYNQKLYSS